MILLHSVILITPFFLCVYELDNSPIGKRGVDNVFECEAQTNYYTIYEISNIAEGYIQSSNFGRATYNDFSKCKWTITVPKNKVK